MKESRPQWIRVAHLLRPQGRRGELLADLLTNFPDRFRVGSHVFVGHATGDGSKSQPREFEVVSSWSPQGKNQGRIVLGLGGLASIEDAERLAGLDILVQSSDRPELSDGSVYVDDLIGCALFDEDALVGTIREVQFMTTADGKRRLAEAAPLLTIDLTSGEVLVPFVKDFVLTMDLAAKKVVMKLPPGLVDLNLKIDTPRS